MCLVFFFLQGRAVGNSDPNPDCQKRPPKEAHIRSNPTPLQQCQPELTSGQRGCNVIAASFCRRANPMEHLLCIRSCIQLTSLWHRVFTPQRPKTYLLQLCQTSIPSTTVAAGLEFDIRCRGPILDVHEVASFDM